MKYELDILSFELNEKTNEIRIEKNHEYVEKIKVESNLNRENFENKCKELSSKIMNFK